MLTKGEKLRQGELADTFGVSGYGLGEGCGDLGVNCVDQIQPEPSRLYGRGLRVKDCADHAPRDPLRRRKSLRCQYSSRSIEL